MSKLQPWQNAVGKFLTKLPPVPAGYKRRWYMTRKRVWAYYDYKLDR